MIVLEKGMVKERSTHAQLLNMPVESTPTCGNCKRLLMLIATYNFRRSLNCDPMQLNCTLLALLQAVCVLLVRFDVGLLSVLLVAPAITSLHAVL